MYLCIFPLYFLPPAIDLTLFDASQSSVMSDGEAELAIDGDDNPDFSEGASCIITEAGN